MALRLNWAERMYFNELMMKPVRKPARPLSERMLEAEVKCSQALADANAAADCGNNKKADRLYESSQRWLDKYNTLKERTYSQSSGDSKHG